MIVDFDNHLILGAYDKDLEKVKEAIEGGANVNYDGVWGKTALLLACDHDGSFEIAKYLIDHGADVNKGGDYSKDTPLTYASMYGHLEIVKLLIDAGADVNLKGEYDRAPLHYASSPGGLSKNKYEIVKLLLEHGADPNALNEAEENPLLDSIWHEGFDIEIAKLLIEYGIDLETKGSFDSTALTRAIENKRLDLVELFKEKKEDLLAKKKDLNSALAEALGEKDNKDMLFYLLEQGADIRHKERFGTSVLSYAAEYGYIDLIEYLIEHGLDLTEDLDDTNQALRDAAYAGQFEVIKFLVKHGGPDLVKHDYGGGENSLMKAARYDYVEIANFLIENGADLEVRDSSGNTPLLFAAYEGNYKVAKLLMEKGADIQAKNEMNWNALMQAASEGHIDVVRLLLEAGSEVNVRGKEIGETPLILASWKNAPEIVKLLLEYNADKTIKDTNGDTALDYAKKENYRDVIALLQ